MIILPKSRFAFTFVVECLNLPCLAILIISSGVASVVKSKSFGFLPRSASLTAPPTT